MEQKKRILIVGPSPDRSRGGMATVIDEIRSDAELNREFDIDIFDSYIDGSLPVRMLFSVFAYLKFRFTGKNYDIYHIHAASRGSTFRKDCYIRAAKKWGKKVILHVHGGQYIAFYQGLSPQKQERVNRFLRAADTVIALSQSWKEQLCATFGLDNCVVLENGINTQKLLPAVTEPEEYRKSFLTLARLERIKGTYDLVNAVEIAAKTTPDIKVYLAGEGDVKEIRQLVREKNLDEQVEIVGWADFDKKLDLLKHVSTVVLPSYYEGLPMSILEGMACGKAVISTTVGAIPEVVTEENGVLLSPGDVKGLADALVNFARDSDRLAAMAEKNREKIDEHYSVKIMHRQLAAYYRDLC